MHEILKIEIESGSKNRSDLANPITAAPRVAILNRTRDVVVTINLFKVPIKDLRWEGRGDRILIFWKEYCFPRRNPSDEFRSDYLVSLFARAVKLPCDVDFSNVVPSLNGSRLTLRLPKQLRKSVNVPFHFALPYLTQRLPQHVWTLKPVAGQPVDNNCQEMAQAY